MKNIPGWFDGIHQREMVKLLYKYNRSDCIGVEVGSLHGRSSYAISIAISKGTLYCIDLWDGIETHEHGLTNEEVLNSNFPPTGMKNTIEIFKENTKDRANIVTIQGHSPECVHAWIKPIDFIFLDAHHTNPNDRDNIDFWLEKIKPGGLFIGHDLGSVFNDVKENVEYMEQLLNQKVKTISGTSLWYFNI
jgi:predicted O-methyltransferase YrrM